MTRQEAKAILVAAFPKHTICIEINDWRFNHITVRDEITFGVSIQPGFNERCSRFEGKTLAGVVDMALARLRDEEGDTANVDDLFVVALS